MLDSETTSHLSGRTQLLIGFAAGACVSLVAMYVTIIYTGQIYNMEITMGSLEGTIGDVIRVQYGLALVAHITAAALLVRDKPWSITGFLRGNGGEF